MTYEYDVVVIGAGAGGLTAAGLASSLGAKTLLVEKDRMGGDCTWTGCVPSKTLLSEAKQAHNAAKYTQTDVSELVDFPKVLERVNSVREQIYEEADSPQALERFGVEVERGHARFNDPHTIAIDSESDSKHVSARFIIIATGASPVVPPVDGLREIDFHTSESIFEIDTQPERLGIIGGGPIGVEMAQAFNRLGSTVHVFESGNSVLSRSDTGLRAQLQKMLDAEGVSIHTNAPAEAVSGGKQEVVSVSTADGEFAVDELLVAVGRRPHTERLDLEAANININKDTGSIAAGPRGQTSQSHIYAVGDVVAGPRFTHVSEQQAKQAVFRALYKLPLSTDKPLPRVTYTDPELAEIGPSQAQLEDKGVSVDVYTFPYDKLDRAVTESKSEGQIKAWTKSGSGTILGAAVLGDRAGELIGEFALAMEHGLSLRDISETMHPYPTYGLGDRRLADQYMIRNQPSWLLKALNFTFGYRGSVLENNGDDVI